MHAVQVSPSTRRRPCDADFAGLRPPGTDTLTAAKVVAALEREMGGGGRLTVALATAAGRFTATTALLAAGGGFRPGAAATWRRRRRGNSRLDARTRSVTSEARHRPPRRRAGRRRRLAWWRRWWRRRRGRGEKERPTHGGAAEVQRPRRRWRSATAEDAPGSAGRLDSQAVGAARGDGRGGGTGGGRGGVTTAVHSRDAHGRVVCAGGDVGGGRGGSSGGAARLWRIGLGGCLLERQVRRPPALGRYDSLKRVVCTPGADAHGGTEG
eukprot:3516919-Pleurochrysis_carterae.AAC.1